MRFTKSSSSERGLPRRSKTKFGDRCFSYASPTLWNALSSNIKAAKSVTQFKKLLKTTFLQILLSIGRCLGMPTKRFEQGDLERRYINIHLHYITNIAKHTRAGLFKTTLALKEALSPNATFIKGIY